MIPSIEQPASEPALSGTRPPVNGRHVRAIELFCLTLLFVLAIVAVDPRGEFPLDDDWDFAFDTWTLGETGTFQFSPFTETTLRAQAVWGAAWSRLFGQSFEVLRASTLFISLATILLLNVMLRSLRVPLGARVLMTLALLFHPIFFWASFTYMTHVPFVFLSLVSFCCFHAAITRHSAWYSVLGALAVVLSFLVRQTGIANAIPPMLAIIQLRKELRVRAVRLLIAPTLTLLLFGALLAFTTVLVPSPQEHQLHRKIIEWSGPSILWNFVTTPYLHIVFNFMSGALFSLPLIAAAAVSGRQWNRTWLAVTGILVALFLLPASWMIRVGNPFPYRNGGNVFTNLGLGPQTLRDTFHLGYLYPAAHIGMASRAVLTISAAVLGAGLLVWVSRSALERSSNGVPRTAILLAAYSALCGSLMLCVMKIFFDRYSLDALWSLPILGAVVINWTRRPTRVAATVMLVMLACFSIIATQEYRSWNRARWEAYRYLRRGGVTLEQMDGGYEINALLALRMGRKNLGRKGFGVMDDEYLITFNPVEGYRPLAAFRYPRVFGLDEGVVLALRRVNSRR